jgi:hypothetical protein
MNDPNELGELETLERVLDFYRGAIVWKLRGVTEDEARRALVPSGTSLLGIVKHLGFTEREWFQGAIAGQDLDLPFDDDDPDGDWVLADEDTIASIIGFYEAECDESRAVSRSVTDPGALVPWDDGEVSVRRVVVHMLEETARHAGHMDILREQIDGATGSFPDD